MLDTCACHMVIIDNDESGILATPLRLNTDVGTRINLVSEVLLNIFISPQLQQQTFQAS